jgi:sulfate adenylyltransferase subunit 1
MDSKHLVPGAKYVVQHGINKVLGKVERINHKIHPDYSGIEKNVTELAVNDIASVTFKLNKPIFYDQFKNHRTNGSFILIDTQSNNTVGAGFIQ